MVRRKKTSIFLDAKESTTVSELKKMVRGITKKGVEDMKLYKDEQVCGEEVFVSVCISLLKHFVTVSWAHVWNGVFTRDGIYAIARICHANSVHPLSAPLKSSDMLALYK